MAQDIINGDRRALSTAITLVESTLQSDRKRSDELLERLGNNRTKSLRIAISGSPGVGKSTFIESLGKLIIAQGYKPAVLSIDPSSAITGGSILGDKTRMESLSKEDRAFIRPTASAGKLGGVSDNTREVIMLCEAAGYNIILLETVGVGQSEIEAHSMTDLFLLFILPNSGDTLQGIKKGIVEMADMLIINKADGNHLIEAEKTAKQYNEALHLLPPEGNGWIKTCYLVSALHSIGIEEVWGSMQAFFEMTSGNGAFDQKRNRQNLQWFNKKSTKDILQWIYNNPAYKSLYQSLEQDIENHKISPIDASNQLINSIKISIK